MPQVNYIVAVLLLVLILVIYYRRRESASGKLDKVVRALPSPIHTASRGPAGISPDTDWGSTTPVFKAPTVQLVPQTTTTTTTTSNSTTGVVYDATQGVIGNAEQGVRSAAGVRSADSPVVTLGTISKKTVESTELVLPDSKTPPPVIVSGGGAGSKEIHGAPVVVIYEAAPQAPQGSAFVGVFNDPGDGQLEDNLTSELECQGLCPIDCVNLAREYYPGGSVAMKSNGECIAGSRANFEGRDLGTWGMDGWAIYNLS